MKVLSVLVCAAACVSPSPLDPVLAAEEQAVWDGGDYDPDGEVVVIEGSFDACWDAGLCWPGVGGEDPTDPGDTGDWGGGGGPGNGYVVMDPEPDRNKDRKSCYDWCAWSRRQCQKECERAHPYPDWDGYNQCLKNRCENHSDPNIGRKSCEADCNKRFPERPVGPILTSELSL